MNQPDLIIVVHQPAPAPVVVEKPIKRIYKLSELKPYDKITIICRQFKAINPAVFVSHDQTGLNRDIGYAAYDRHGFLEPEFAIWQYELDQGLTEIYTR